LAAEVMKIEKGQARKRRSATTAARMQKAPTRRSSALDRRVTTSVRAWSRHQPDGDREIPGLYLG
jgi:hypothetical protein